MTHSSSHSTITARRSCADSSAQTAVSALIEEDDDAAALLVAAYGRGSLVRQLKGVYTRLRSLGITLDEAETSTLAHLGSVEAYRIAVESLGPRIDAVLQTSTTAAAKVTAEEFLAEWTAVRSDVECDPHVEGTVAFFDALVRLRRSAPDARGKLKEPVEALRALIGKDRTLVGTLEAAYFDATARSFAPLLFRTLKTLDRLYAHEKKIASALDYEDLQLRARDLLVDHDEVVRRVRRRYNYFLVDEYQDTNRLQKDIVLALSLGEPKANLFIVGDRKQSIYGFRGAEVEVFGETIRHLVDHGGESIALDVNFRSDPRLIDFFNELFGRLMAPNAESDPRELRIARVRRQRALRRDVGGSAPVPAVELLFELHDPARSMGRRGGEVDDESRETARRGESRSEFVRSSKSRARRRDGRGQGPRTRGPTRALRRHRYPAAGVYESQELRARARHGRGIPCYVVAGKGFYNRPEVADILNLASFLDNRTDELTLAAVLRSPLFGISDETLLAFRAGRLQSRVERSSNARSAPIELLDAVRSHREIGLIAADQHRALDSAAASIDTLLALRNRLDVSELLAEAIRLTEFETVIAATDDGGAKLSNVDKLLALARGFERGGSRLLRDFVEYIREFRRLDSREAEASLRSDEDAVAILTAHKSKGLEFPVVVIPDVQREFPRVDDNFLYDRRYGLGFRIPDGRGGLAKTGHYESIATRVRRRGRFEEHAAALCSDDARRGLSDHIGRDLAPPPPAATPRGRHELASVVAGDSRRRQCGRGRRGRDRRGGRAYHREERDISTRHRGGSSRGRRGVEQ